MKGNKKVLESLNEALSEELTAINQYIVHSEMCENWGYDKLATFIKKESIDEMKHADALIERVLFLEGLPNLQSSQEQVQTAVASNRGISPLLICGENCFYND